MHATMEVWLMEKRITIRLDNETANAIEAVAENLLLKQHSDCIDELSCVFKRVEFIG